MFSKEAGVVAIAGGGKNIVGDDVADGAPGEDIDDVESHGVVGFEEADVFLGADVAGFEVGNAVLLRHLLRHVFPLEVEEHEPAQEQGQPSAQADHHRRVQLRLDAQGLPGAQGAAEGGGGGLHGEGVGGLVEGPQTLEGWSGEQGGGHCSCSCGCGKGVEIGGQELGWIDLDLD